MARSFSRGLALALVLAVAGPLTLAYHRGATIRGLIIDPHQLHPEDLTLMLGWPVPDQVIFDPVPIKSDGTFVTRPLDPGTYILRLVRSWSSRTKRETLLALTTVSLGISDVSHVIMEVPRDTALTGSFRMESDNPNAQWPTSIVVNAPLALDGLEFPDSTAADGAPGGKFILRNAFGPRVLRCGYHLAPGSKWWPSRVLLDGVDITNVPTDFSAHENGRLEVWFTQHPAQIRGSVIGASGRPAKAPWILVAPANPAWRQPWSSMLYAVQGNTRGEFSVAVMAGEYLVTAASQETFESDRAARRNALRLSSRGMWVQVKTREIKQVKVPIPGGWRNWADH